MKLLVTPYFNFNKVIQTIESFGAKKEPIQIKVNEDLLMVQEGHTLE